MKVVPLRTRAARRAVVAPDLDRYLDPRNVDLVVTDQVQAVRVRVERGLEVFEKRLRCSLKAVMRWIAASAVLLPCCVAAAWTAGRVLYRGDGGGVWHWIAAAAATAAALTAGVTLAGAVVDFARLRRRVGRFKPSDLDDLETSRDLLDYAETVLREARGLGAIPHRE